MKKLMLGVLILIPIIVVLTIGLVANFVSVMAYIAVESVTVENDNIELERTLSESDWYSAAELYELMGVKVLPERATNKDVEITLSGITPLDPEITDVGGDGIDDVTGEYYVRLFGADKETVVSLIGTAAADNGYLAVTEYCTFDLTVTAEGSVSARCSVRVTGDLTAIRLDGASSVRIGERISLGAIYTPIDAEVRDIEWSSSAPGVATVDRNGIVLGVSEGSAVITASAVTADGRVEGSVTVEVVRGATLFGSEVHTHLREIALSDLGFGSAAEVNRATLENCSLVGNTLVIDADAEEAMFVTAAGEPVSFVVVGENDLVIHGAKDGDVLDLGGVSVWLTVDWLSDLRTGPAPEITEWRTSDASVAAVDAGGNVTAKSGGQVTVTALTGGGDVSVDLVVARKIAVVQTQETEKTMQAGLACETVVATGRYGEGGSIVGNSFAVGIRYPVPAEGEDEQAFYRDFVFELTAEGMDADELAKYARFEGNTVIFDYDKAHADGAFEERTKVTVTVSARYPKYDDESLSRYATTSFFFYVVDGIETSSYDEMKTALTSGIAVALAASVPVTRGNEGIDVYADIYGNGYMVHAEKDQMGSTSGMFVVKADGVTVSNLTVRANAVPEDGKIDAATYQAGYCIRYFKFNGRMMRDERIEYCVLENARVTMGFAGAEATVEGCIIRNTSGGGVHIQNRANTFNDVTFRNSVFSNCLSPSNFEYKTDYNGDDTDATPNVAEGDITRSRLTIEGFLDVYGWYDINEGSFVPDATLKDALSSVGGGTVDDAQVDAVQALLRTAALESTYLEQFRRSYEGGVYVHVAFMSTGLTARSWLVEEDNYTCEDERFHVVSSSDIDSTLLDAISNLLKNPLYLWSYDDSVTDLTPASVLVVNTALIERLHGER